MPSEPREEPKQEGRADEKRQADSNKGRASAAALVEAFANQYAADREENKSKERHRTFREWLTIVGLFLAAAVAGFQWHELRSTDHNIARQAEIASKQLKELVSSGAQTERTIAAFERLAEAATKSGTTQGEASERQLRAYLVIEPKRVIWTKPATATIEFEVKNVGLTPAYKIKSMTRVDVFEDQPKDEELRSGIFAISKASPYAFPGVEYSVSLFKDFDAASVKILQKAGAVVVLCAGNLY